MLQMENAYQKIIVLMMLIVLLYHINCELLILKMLILDYFHWRKGYYYTNLTKRKYFNIFHLWYANLFKINIFRFEHLPHNWSLGGFEDVPYLALSNKNVIHIYNLLNYKKNKYVYYIN
jgi:hypothetical protein